MFKIVDEAECRRYRSDCSAVLKKVCSMLKGKEITAQFTLVGSGARNMVTRNGDGPFDLDYNLEIIKAPEKYWKDLRHLKNTVRILDSVYTNQARMAAQIAIQRTCTAARKASEVFA